MDRPVKRLALGASAALFLATSSAAAQIEPGRVYVGGERISEPELSLALTIPKGWRGQLSSDGEAFQLRSESGSGAVVVLADQMSAAQAQHQMAQPIDLGDGIVLTLADPVQEVATRHFSAGYTVRGALGLVGRIDVRVTQTGFGVAFIRLSPPAEVGTHETALRELAFSLGVEDPGRQAAGADAGAGDAWQPYLEGKYLARYFTRTGYTESTELWLCSNGAFYYKSQGGGFGGGASGAVAGSGEGRWSATGSGATGTLMLNWSSGGRTTLELSYDYENDRLYLNGERMLRGQNEYCP